MKKFDIPEFYKSGIIGKIKEIRRQSDKLKRDFTASYLDLGSVEFYLARHFGFCYGVENAVEIAYKTLEENPQKRIFLLSEMIHNPEVNADLLSRGVKFLMDTSGNDLLDWDELTADDIVIVPAFGTTIDIQNRLNSIGINPYQFDTTCPFVEKVWNRAGQIGERGYTVVVHGKPKHEETRATFSHSKASTPTVVVKDIKEAYLLGEYINGKREPQNFSKDFNGQYSEGFDPEKHLKKIGVVNQTTMLASETQEISDYLKEVITDYYSEVGEMATERFANTRDTLCYATNDNQEATYALLREKADLAIVVGGYNSSNTSHLVELCEEQLPTYFIRSAESLLSNKEIEHYDLRLKTVKVSKNYLPEKNKTTILLTCGASCPDAIMEKVLLKLSAFFKDAKDMNLAITSLEYAK